MRQGWMPAPPAERLMLWSLRAVALGGLGDSGVERAHRAAFGPAGEGTAVALKALIAGVSAAARRTVAVGLPCRGCITPDERTLLSAISATGRADYALAHALLGTLVAERHVDAITHAAEQVAEALAAVGAALDIAPPQVIAHQEIPE